MFSNYRLFLVTLAIVISAATPLFGQSFNINFTAAPVFMLGDDADEFDTGYSVSPGFEIRFGRYVGLHLAPGYTYVYYEMEVPFFGVYVDNRIVGMKAAPRAYLPLAKEGRAEFFAGPTCAYSYIKSDVEVWYVDLSFNDHIREYDYDKYVFSVGVEAGFQYNFGDHFSALIGVAWENMDVGQDMNELDYAFGSMGSYKIETSAASLNLGVKYTY